MGLFEDISNNLSIMLETRRKNFDSMTPVMIYKQAFMDGADAAINATTRLIDAKDKEENK
jgi:hypothetical protein